MADVEPKAFGLPQPGGDHQRVKLADLIPLVEWQYRRPCLGCGEWDKDWKAEFKVRPTHRNPWEKDCEPLRVDLTATVWGVPDVREGDGRSTTAEAMLTDIPATYPDVESALLKFREVSRILVLHEVDETLRFAGMLPFDPHTDDRERNWPGTEDLP